MGDLISTLLPNSFGEGLAYAVVAIVPLALGLSFSAFYVLNRAANRAGRTMSFNSWCTLGDGAFLPEVEAALPIINAVLFFEKCPPQEKVVEIARALLTFNRFSSKVIRYSATDYRWVKIDVDPEKHVMVNKVKSEDDMYKKIEELKSADLRNGVDAPLWEFQVLENTAAGQPSAVILRVHHGIGDGISLSGIIPLIFTDEKGNHPKVKDYSKGGGARPKFTTLQIIKAFFDCLAKPLSKFDSDTPFCPHPKGLKLMKMGERKTIFFPPIDFEKIQDLKNKGKCTVNDILMAVWAGAITRYNAEHAEGSTPTAKMQFRALLPVAFPRKQAEFVNAEESMRNYFCFISAPLAVGVDGITNRLAATIQHMLDLKNSPQAGVNMKMMSLAGKLPRAMSQKTASDLFSRHSFVFSNVPGPQTPLWFGGEKMTSIQVVYANVLPQLIAMSYNGNIHQNVVVDENFQNPEALIKAFHLELDEFQQVLSEDGSL